MLWEYRINFKIIIIKLYYPWGYIDNFYPVLSYKPLVFGPSLYHVNTYKYKLKIFINFQCLHTIPRGESVRSHKSVECAGQLHDPVVCDRAHDRPAHSALQEALLPDHPRLAHTVISDAALHVLVLVFRVSFIIYICVTYKECLWFCCMLSNSNYNEL